MPQYPFLTASVAAKTHLIKACTLLVGAVLLACNPRVPDSAEPIDSTAVVVVQDTVTWTHQDSVLHALNFVPDSTTNYYRIYRDSTWFDTPFKPNIYESSGYVEYIDSTTMYVVVPMDSIRFIIHSKGGDILLEQ